MADMKKVAMVTGAGSGVGKATVLALAAEGYACVLAGRRKEPIEAVAAEIAGNGGEAIAVSADVSDPASVDALFARAKEAYGRLDVIFNNAGINVAATPSITSEARPVGKSAPQLDPAVSRNTMGMGAALPGTPSMCASPV